jgi:bla regulator protein blaR1
MALLPLSAWVTWRLNWGRSPLLFVAMAMVVVPVLAASQTVMLNTDHAGRMLHATAARPSFEVASIRPSVPNEQGSCCTVRRDGIEIRGYPIKDVIEFAYAVPDEQEFSGGPSWIRTERFDITAKVGDAEALAQSALSSADLRVQMRLMLQSLLEERLHLKVSFAMKELPLFVLVVAKGGFKCTSAVPIAVPSDGATGPPPPPPPPPPALSADAPPGYERPMHWDFRRLPFSLLVGEISYQPEVGGRVVVDKTGLNGAFDCKLSWAGEGPSFLTALQEQLGLKLEPAKGPVETLVVEQVELPSEN